MNLTRIGDPILEGYSRRYIAKSLGINMMLRLATTRIALGLCLLLLLGQSSRSDEKMPGVSLILTKVSAERSGQGVRFLCQVVLDNDTGKQLIVSSNFYSAFDGLELVITNVRGKVLVQRPYIIHQSPFTRDGRDFSLKSGKTKKTLSFPLRSFGTVGEPIRVRLVGTLPGSSYNRILSTDTIQITIAKQDK